MTIINALCRSSLKQVCHPLEQTSTQDKLSLPGLKHDQRSSPDVVSSAHRYSLLSMMQVRVFVPNIVGKESPSVVVTDVNEINLKQTLTFEHNALGPKEFKFSSKPFHGRVVFSTHCTEHKLETHDVFVPVTRPYLDTSKCIKSVGVPHRVGEAPTCSGGFHAVWDRQSAKRSI